MAFARVSRVPLEILIDDEAVLPKHLPCNFDLATSLLAVAQTKPSWDVPHLANQDILTLPRIFFSHNTFGLLGPITRTTKRFNSNNGFTQPWAYPPTYQEPSFARAFSDESCLTSVRPQFYSNS